MEEKINNPIEVQKDSGTGLENRQTAYISGKPYSKLPREFSEDDLTSSAGQRFLLSEIDRLEHMVSELENYEKEFFNLDKENAILKEKLKSNKSNDIIYGLFLTIGSVIIGLAPFFWDNNPKYGIACIAIGSIMLISGIVIKFIQWK